MSLSRVWVVRTGALGDFVATLPVLHGWRRVAAHLTVVAPRRYASLFSEADRWLDSDDSEVLRLFRGDLDLGNVDLAVAYTTTFAAALVEAKAQCVLRTTPTPAPGIAIHDHLWAPCEPFLGPRTQGPNVVPEARRLAAMRARLLASGFVEPPVVLAPGSGGLRKRWSLLHWHQIACSIRAPLWVGGPAEAGEMGWGVPHWEDLDLADLAALAALCSGWVAPDSGTAHLAAAVGAPTAVVFVGATDPKNWAPPGAQIFEFPSSEAGSPALIVAWLHARPPAGRLSAL